MRRSQHEAAIRQHLSALAWADDARAKAFVRRLAGLFGIFEATGEEIERATFLAEHARFHGNRRLTQRRQGLR